MSPAGCARRRTTVSPCPATSPGNCPSVCRSYSATTSTRRSWVTSTAGIRAGSCGPGTDRPSGSSREVRLDGGDDLRVLRLDQRPEPGDDLPVRADQELLKVPLDVAGLTLGVGNRG